MTDEPDPSLWELLGLDRNDTIAELPGGLWERILDVATDPDTPDADAGLIPDDDIDTGGIGHDAELDDELEPLPFGDDTDLDPHDGSITADGVGHDDFGHEEFDPGDDVSFGPDDSGSGSDDDLAF
ncbi:MAG: hypothetical protein WAX14_21795 [Rhodococcus sp. (in: high G+C Gram-positive bacteria)]|uniref:hypothetical protein n=1 Tax=Rhodococcus sp. TaxID=1831 RepID=UPI003BB7999A